MFTCCRPITRPSGTEQKPMTFYEPPSISKPSPANSSPMPAVSNEPKVGMFANARYNETSAWSVTATISSLFIPPTIACLVAFLRGLYDYCFSSIRALQTKRHKYIDRTVNGKRSLSDFLNCLNISLNKWIFWSCCRGNTVIISVNWCVSIFWCLPNLSCRYCTVCGFWSKLCLANCRYVRSGNILC